MNRERNTLRGPIRTGSDGSSLRNKLLLFTAGLVLVSGVLLVVVAERSSSTSLERVIGRQLAREAEHTAGRLSGALRGERETLESFARQDLMREIRVGDIDKRISLALTTLRDGGDARVDYAVVDTGLRVVAASDPALLGSTPGWLDPAWGRADAGERLIGPSDASPPRLLLVASIPDPDVPQRFLGTLVGILDWERLTQVTAHVQRELSAQGIAADVLVTRADGRVIGGSQASARSGVRESGFALPPTDAGTGFGVDEDAGLIIGRADLAPDLPEWQLQIVQSRADALAPARQASRRLALAMGVVLVAALGLATLAARRVVEPLTELTRAIRGLSSGDPNARRVPVRSEDEVGALATAFNEMASELDRAQRELVEAEKFAFVGELAAGVAHEIRTALNVLGSSAQILERSLPADADPEATELAEMIRAEVGRLAGVVNDLLTLARGRPLAIEPSRLSEPLFRAADFVAPQARDKGCRIERRAPPREVAVPCDSELLYQVAVNLLANAIQALGYGGCIEIRVLEPEDGHGGFEVRDDGPGIPEQLCERIFEPFVTNREGGVGLGLTFVKRVVHDHRGSISLESKPGAGTCIRILLPLAGVAR